MATAGVLLFKGGAGVGARVERSGLSVERSEPQGMFGCPHTTWCIHKVVHTQGGLWPPQESCYLRGVQGLAPVSSEASCRQGLAIHTHRGVKGGAHIRRCIHKVVHTQGGLWPPQESCYFSGAQGLAPLSREASCRQGLAIHTQGVTRGCTHKAVHTQGGLWPPQEFCYLRQTSLNYPWRHPSYGKKRRFLAKIHVPLFSGGFWCFLVFFGVFWFFFGVF